MSRKNNDGGDGREGVVTHECVKLKLVDRELRRGEEGS